MAMTFLFPGQGSQKVGMGADFRDAFASVRRRFDEADEILGRDLTRVFLEGPAEELTATSNTQPALFTVESAVCDVLRERGVGVSLALGHSLGEYSALYAAGVYSFADGLKLVAKRGELMAEAGRIAPGAMAAVIGLSREAVGEGLSAVSAGVVVAANENAPEQTVISGEAAAVAEAGEKLRAAGAKRVVNLAVSGAFHSPLMQRAADAFGEYVAAVQFHEAQCGVVTNVSARAETDPETLKQLLVKQLVSPVRWVDAIAYVKQQGAVSCVEVGPGAVLRGLVRKCDPQISVAACETVADLYSLAPHSAETEETA